MEAHIIKEQPWISFNHYYSGIFFYRHLGSLPFCSPRVFPHFAFISFGHFQLCGRWVRPAAMGAWQLPTSLQHVISADEATATVAMEQQANRMAEAQGKLGVLCGRWWQGKWHCTFPCGMPWNEKRVEREAVPRRVTQLSDAEPSWREIDKIHQQERARWALRGHTHTAYTWFSAIVHSSRTFLSISPLQTYFTFDSRAEQQTEVYLRYGQHPELYPNRRGEVVQGWVKG